MDVSYFKIVVYVPSSHADAVRTALTENGAGRLGKYDSCTFSTKGTGRFKAREGSKPFAGEVGKMEEIEEERIETLCSKDDLGRVMKAVREAHPYEEPAIDLYHLYKDV